LGGQKGEDEALGAAQLMRQTPPQGENRRSEPSVARIRSSEPGPTNGHIGLHGLALAALGVVFGDIGTSPLYAFKQCFGRFEPTVGDVLGILSLITWALILVVCVKYASVVLRADNDGEGGTLALLAQLCPSTRIGIPPRMGGLGLLLLFAAGMVLGDGMITPAISVLSAVEGISVATTAAHPVIVPLTVLILLALFLVQSRGTGRIGTIFGPVMLLWFGALAAGGFTQLVRAPQVLAAFNPIYALSFIVHNGLVSILVLGAVVLCVTGVEALYADLAHFGRRPIWLAWYVVVFPALLLNYYGQGALTIRDPHALSNPFYALFPSWALIPMVVLATAATVIASQALISGAFSLTQQAVQLGYLPRLRVVHTSHQLEGQIYMPFVNALLAVACILLVLSFRSSDRLGSAYGLAVTGTMLVDSIVIGFVMRRRFRWSPVAIALLVPIFLIVDLAFLAGNLPKLPEGGYFPLAIAVVVFVIFTTWVAGRTQIAVAVAMLSVPVEEFIREVDHEPASFAEGTAIFLTPYPEGIPFILRHHWLKTRSFREEVVLLTIVNERRPYVSAEERVEVTQIVPRLTRVKAHYGFMETPNIHEIVGHCRPHVPPEIELEDADYFLARPRLRTGKHDPSWPAWRRWLLDYMMRNANPLTDSLGIPVDRIIEFGVALQL
jgi:KUP system potassium uptake protein